MVIYPEVLVTPDTPTIKFHQPREQVDLEKELPRILHAQGWGVGTYFNVQFISHDKTKLLACAKFVVSEEVESVHTSDANPYQPVTKTVFSRRAEQIGDWWPEQREVLRDLSKMDIVDPPLVGPLMTAPDDGLAKQAGPAGTEVFKRRGRPPKTEAA